MQSICNGWYFSEKWNDGLLNTVNGVECRLPHTVKEIPLHYADSDSYQMICGYCKELMIPESAKGKRLFLQFDGAAHIATVYINGSQLCTHRNGYSGFRVEITEYAQIGQVNHVAVRLDTTENAQIPPFGFVIDYLTYGGLYREVWLDIREREWIRDIFVKTPTLDTVEVDVDVDADPGHSVSVEILDGNSSVAEGRAGNTISCKGVAPWETSSPKLYTCKAVLKDHDGKIMDVQSRSFGFRTVEFRGDGFFLNGTKTFMRGLNRHQSWPYVGYAVPESLQREDARILKEELGCNAVRTSHYPQSQHFLDACDQMGILVVTEIPGWQHIGDEQWKEQALENTREMILENRNHPSIVLWGVRINESIDDDVFYRKTNELAHKLDPTRSTTGVRYLEKSSLLEDVYAFNDFSHIGTNAGVKKKKDVTKDMNKALLVSECNGHMFPTKAYDDWRHRQDHAMRHARVQNDAVADGQHVGCFGWCMFDYPTHKDFGSGDRICYHGVMDAFRNPKLAAAVYASQGSNTPVLEIGSSMDIGDYPGGQIGDVFAFTNADEVKLYKNDQYVTNLSTGALNDLPHGPMKVSDTIGCLLETQEGFSAQKAKLLRECLLDARDHGMANLPPKTMAKMAWCMLHYGLKYEDGVSLYGKYVGNWGGEATQWRFDAICDGKVVKSVTKCPGKKLCLKATVSHEVLEEKETFDMAAVRIRVEDEFGNVAPYAQLPVQFSVEGVLELVGPSVVTAEGGMCGTYLRTTGTSGTACLHINAVGLDSIDVSFSVR